MMQKVVIILITRMMTDCTHNSIILKKLARNPIGLGQDLATVKEGHHGHQKNLRLSS